MRPHSSALYRNWLTDLVFLFLFLFIFYTLWLGRYPFFTPDEGRYAEIAREMVATKNYITPRVNGIAFLDKPIFYYWLQALAIHLFGVKEWALRLFPALSGVLGCLVTYICGRQLFDRCTGFLAAMLLGTTPLYFACAHYADLNLEVAVFISCSLLFFITAVQTKPFSRYYFLLAYVFAALAFLTKGLIGIAFPSMIIGCWMLLLNRFRLITHMHLITGLLLFTAIVLPWYVLVQQANPGFLHYFFVTQQVTRFLSAAEFNNKTPFWFYLPVVLIGFFPWTIFLFQTLYQSVRRIWQAPQKQATELFLLLWVLLIFIFFSMPHSKIIGYILPILPPLALLVGHCLADYWKGITSKSVYFNTLSFIFISILFAGILVAIPHYQWLDLSPQMTTYANIMASIWVGSAGIALFFIRRHTIKPLIFICLSCNLLFLSVLTHSASYLNKNSTKRLTLSLKSFLLPTDDVITYFKFYQDVPLYLGRRITIVADWHAADIAKKDNWTRELWYGIPYKKQMDYSWMKKHFGKNGSAKNVCLFF